ISGLLAVSFNRVLLRHGYHFKDPGAGIAHGEYTHRIQWYALVSDWATIGAKNKPLDVFKSFGSLWSRQGVDESLHYGGAPAKGVKPFSAYYLWEMLFDCAATQGPMGGWKPFSQTFTCPEALHTYLTPRVLQYNDQLFTLRALMRARLNKRSGDT